MIKGVPISWLLPGTVPATARAVVGDFNNAVVGVRQDITLRRRVRERRYRYLRVREFLYWTSRSLWTPGQNLNRRPASDVEGDPAHEQTRLPLEC